MDHRQEIATDEVVRLYCEERLSTEDVARRVGWSASAVRFHLVALGIARRTPWARNAVACDPDELQRLYVDEGLSLSAIAAKYGCTLTTIWRRLQAAGIQCREGGSEPKYVRTDFSSDLAEKAYLVGFRIGDLNVELHGNTVVVKCTSTRTEQVKLFRNLFERYGHVYTDEATLARRQRQLACRLRSICRLSFCCSKRITCRSGCSMAATRCSLRSWRALPRGYRTAQAQLEIRTYDGVLMGELGEELNARGIACPPAVVRVKAGYVNGNGVRSNGVLWGLGMSSKASLRSLFQKIDPHLRHPKRRRDMIRAWEAID